MRMQFRKIWQYVVFLWHSLFRGMASADTVIQTNAGHGDAFEAVREVHAGSVWDDLLHGRETQRVKEFRDRYYRILRDADKFDTSILWKDRKRAGYDKTPPRLMKKGSEFYSRQPVILNEEGYKVRTVQDNRIYGKPIPGSLNDAIAAMPKGLYDYDTTLEIERDGITPRFKIEKFVKRMVVRMKDDDNGRRYVDMYLPAEASQFGKIDAILISNLHTMMKEGNLKTDITDIKSMRWYSDKAWNTDDFYLFEYNDVRPEAIHMFDGSFVITFDCHAVHDGEDNTTQYRQKEVSIQYEKNQPKQEAIDIFTLQRKIEEGCAIHKDELTHFKNENSN